ncbi:MAG: hypothetical protein KAW12_29170 [Candidatus Aminicenantes bacterium]|nr:hypothetical protein [Candidatus Aminicenantes bacterium]
MSYRETFRIEAEIKNSTGSVLEVAGTTLNSGRWEGEPTDEQFRDGGSDNWGIQGSSEGSQDIGAEVIYRIIETKIQYKIYFDINDGKDDFRTTPEGLNAKIMKITGDGLTRLTVELLQG